MPKKNYFDRVASQYDSQIQSHFLWNYIKQRETQLVMAEMELSRGKSVLDLGSGTGHYAVLCRRQGAMVVCVDSSPHMVEVLKAKRFDAVLEGFESLQLDFEFERVMAIGSLEFVQNLEEGVDCIFRHLRVGGYCIVMVPKGGVVGWIYKKVHQMWGCATYIREPKQLLNTFANFQLQLVKCKKGLISEIYVFKKC